ncbi:NodT family efflux transporter outer membrane factor (OMF) lipoprotein [Pseudomonas duriflava]|uniref:NodT family efflux transporter outer membrane factor (OMF) lipoprotein n=1 Tax=Pseudomonas duriflava TaxID=459528 RepID=A0A562Q6B7_9PSED|nr:efflux transporter outer membrane subunit [Pseudomonas duriflava]TWI52292.1 NodT family efflux transporter outer membrane factor (OMF) lipoprotein [Pseudomonas duriflava]
MKLRFSLTALTLALTLAGCVSPRGLHTEGQALDATHLHSEKTLAGTTLSPAAWPQSDWWNSLGDSQLDSLIREALQSSPDLQVADARSRQASAAVVAANAARQPTVDGNASVTRSRLSRVNDPVGLGDRYSTLRELSIGGSYTFDIWGGQRDAWEAAVGRARASEVDRKAAELTVAANVSRAYNQLGQAYVLSDLAEQDLKRTRAMLNLAQRRVEAGLDSEFQLQQTQSLEAAAQAQYTAARQQVDSAQIRLAVLLGKGPDRGGEIARPHLIAPKAVSLPSQLPADLLGRRPDLIAARWRVEAASKDIEATKTTFYPNLNLVTEAGTQSLLGDALLGAPSRFFNIGPALSLPIFDGGRRRADLASRNADYDLAVAQYNQTLVKALGDISESLSNLHSLDQQIQEQQRARDIAQASFDIAMQLYGAGIGNYLDALSVEQQLFQAERQLASLAAQRVDNAILLMQALGGGFAPSSSMPPALSGPRAVNDR